MGEIQALCCLGSFKSRLSFNKTLFLSSLLLMSSARVLGGENVPSFLIESYSYSEIAPIKQVLGDLKGPNVRDGNIAFTTNLIEFGVSTKFDNGKGGFTYALFSRYDYSLTFTSDTAKLIYAEKNDVELEENQHFDIDLTANHLRASGIKIGYLGDVSSDFSFQINVSYLYANALTDGRLWGDVDTGDELDGSVSGGLFLDYLYSDDALFNREPSGIKGQGYSVDVKLLWDYSSKLHFEVDLKDVSSRIYWRDQHHTTAIASPDTIRYDDSGRLNVRPALTWIEREKNHQQHLPRQIYLLSRYQLSGGGAVEYVRYIYDGEAFDRVGIRRQIADNVMLSSFYDTDTKAFNLGVKTQYFHVAITSDSFKLKKAFSFGFTFGVYVPM